MNIQCSKIDCLIQSFPAHLLYNVHVYSGLTTHFSQLEVLCVGVVIESSRVETALCKLFMLPFTGRFNVLVHCMPNC